MADKRYIPNSFQVPNVYIDDLLRYLTPHEGIVLWVAIRHILGWQETISSRQNHVSISRFVEHTGLGREAVVSALKNLDEFGILKKVGEADAKGQLWYLPDDPEIAWEKLEARQQQKKATGRRRVATARKNKAAGLSDRPANGPDDPSVGQTGGSLSDRPAEGDSRSVGQKHLNPIDQTQDQTHLPRSGEGDISPSSPSEEKAAPPPPTKPPKTRKRKDAIPAEEINPLKEAIADAFGYDRETMNESDWGVISRAAKLLHQSKVQPGEVADLQKWCAAQGWERHFSPAALANNVQNWRKDIQQGAWVNGELKRSPQRNGQRQPPADNRHIGLTKEDYERELQRYRSGVVGRDTPGREKPG